MTFNNELLEAGTMTNHGKILEIRVILKGCEDADVICITETGKYFIHELKVIPRMTLRDHILKFAELVEKGHDVEELVDSLLEVIEDYKGCEND